jgi:hypothetical protein
VIYTILALWVIFIRTRVKSEVMNFFQTKFESNCDFLSIKSDFEQKLLFCQPAVHRIMENNDQNLVRSLTYYSTYYLILKDNNF